MSPDLKAAWNRSHERIPKDKQPSRYALEKEKLFPRNSKICDLGGGTGADAIFFIQQGHSVTLVDISDLALKVATKKAQEKDLSGSLETLQVDLNTRAIPLPDNSFDRVFSRMALHYFDVATTTGIFGEVYRILKPGGVAYLTLKSPADVEDMKVATGEFSQRDPGVFVSKDGQIKSRFSIDQLKAMLSEAGVVNFEVHEHVEQMDGRIDVTKSGLPQMILNEVILRK